MRFGLNTFLYASPFTNDSVKLFSKLKKWGFDYELVPVNGATKGKHTCSNCGEGGHTKATCPKPKK